MEINSLFVTFWCATRICWSSTPGRAEGEGTGVGKDVSAALTFVTGIFLGLPTLWGKGQAQACWAQSHQPRCWLQLDNNIPAIYSIHLISQRTVLSVQRVSLSCSLAFRGIFTPAQAVWEWVLTPIYIFAKWLFWPCCSERLKSHRSCLNNGFDIQKSIFKGHQDFFKGCSDGA